MPQTRDRLKKSCESCGCRDSVLSTSMLAMIKFVACSPPGKIIFSTVFCRNFSDVRLKACMKALQALCSASWTQTENVFRLTATLPVKEMPSLISRDLWLPKSPDLNPVDYKIWGVRSMQDRVKQKKMKDVNELRERMIEVWAGLQQNVIDDAIDQWRSRRLCACVPARGGHFEYLL